MVEPWLNLIVIRTANLDRAAEFYRILGMTLVPEKHGKGPEHFSFSSGGIVFEIYPAKTAEDVDATTRLGFDVGNISEIGRQLVSVGFKITPPPTDGDNLEHAVAIDPDGRKVELRKDVRYTIGRAPHDIDELIRTFVEHIESFYKRPSMYVGSLNEPAAVEAVLWWAHMNWSLASGRPFRAELDKVRGEEKGGCTGLRGAFDRRYPNGTPQEESEYLITCWKRVSQKLGIIPMDDDASERQTSDP